MFTWKRLIVALFLLVAALMAFVALLLPGIVKNQAEQWVVDKTGRVLEVGRISINPLTLVVEIDQLSLSNLDQTDRFVSWDQLRVALSPRSLYHWAPILREISLVEPYVRIERLDHKTFNFSDLIQEPAPAAEPETESKPARFSLNNLVLENGRIELVDRSLDSEISHTVRDLNLAIPFLGNLPYLVEQPVQPHLSAVINDSPIAIQGELTPFAATREFSLDLALNDIDLPYYLAYIPLELPIELRSGRLAFDLQLRYRAGMQQKPELLLSGVANLSALDIWDKQEEQLFFMPLLRAEIEPSRLLEQDIHLSTLDIYNLAVNVSRDQDGSWNHAQLAMPAGKASPQAAATEDEGPALNLRVDRFRVHDAEVHFIDQLPPGGFATEAREINLDIDRFVLDSTEPAPFKLALKTDFDETLAVKGNFRPTPLTIELQTEARNLQLSAYAPYYADAYSLPLGGILHLRANLDINPAQPLLISDGNIEWHDAALAFTEQEGVEIERIEIAGLSFDLGENRLEIDSTFSTNGRVAFSRDSQGHWSLLSDNFPGLTRPEETAETKPATDEQPAGPEFSYQIDKLEVADWSVEVHDRLPSSPVHLQAGQVKLRFENLAGPQRVESPFEFSTTFASQGSIDLKGTASLAAQSVSLDANVGRIPLTTFAPYVADQANLVLRDGSFDANLNVSVKPGPDTIRINFSGDLGVSRFSLLDGTYKEDLLKWDSLQVAGLDGSWGPLALALESITISDYFAKVLIDEQARLNFALALRQPGQDDGGPPESDSSSPPADIRVSQITLQGGQVDFTDRHLPRTFQADMRELGGSIRGLSSKAEARAAVDLRGKLRGQSPLVIEGEVNPLAEDIFLDLRLNFSDIEMSPMSPYSGTYLGYLIDKGKLNLALEYHVEDGELQAINEVFLDQFTFGEAVESEAATGLPVRLAVALLKDRNGEIHLDIPVSGALDDPQFSVVGVVWKIIRNLLVKAATSPLALLGALAGGGDEDFGSIEFAFGSTELAPPQLEKLEQLGQALKQRPALNLEVQGFIDPDNDPEGYRHEQLRLKIERARQRDLAQTGEEQDKLPPLNEEEYSDYLWEVYKEEDFPKPRNFIGMVKHLPDEELGKLIYTNIAVGQAELARLAEQRARRVKDYLVEQVEIEPERVFLSIPDINRPPEEEDVARSRVEFDISVN